MPARPVGLLPTHRLSVEPGGRFADYGLAGLQQLVFVDSDGVVYTREEWESGTVGDWSYTEADGLRFQGQVVHGSQLERLTRETAFPSPDGDSQSVLHTKVISARMRLSAAMQDLSLLELSADDLDPIWSELERVHETLCLLAIATDPYAAEGASS